jgi:hypothetical protein
MSLVKDIPKLGLIEEILFKDLYRSSIFFLALLISALKAKFTFNYFAIKIFSFLSILFYKIKNGTENNHFILSPDYSYYILKL